MLHSCKLKWVRHLRDTSRMFGSFRSSLGRKLTFNFLLLFLLTILHHLHCTQPEPYLNAHAPM